MHFLLLKPNLFCLIMPALHSAPMLLAPVYYAQNYAFGRPYSSAVHYQQSLMIALAHHAREVCSGAVQSLDES